MKGRTIRAHTSLFSWVGFASCVLDLSVSCYEYIRVSLAEGAN
jgi:hypothetical protein